MASDYSNYSLRQLDEWVLDALQNNDLTPSDIHDRIVATIQENIDYHSQCLSRAQSLMNLVKPSNSYSTSFPPSNWNYEIPTSLQSDFWEENYYPEEYYKNVMPSATQRDLDLHAEIDAMCKNASSSEEKELCQEYATREAEYYAQKDSIDKWILPVELSYVNGEEDYILSLPNDLLARINWKEGDQLEWVPNDDGSYTLRKVS